MRFPSNGIRVLRMICAVLALSVSMCAQTTTGRIIGNVHDQSGAAVAGAALTVTDLQRGIVRNVTTDDSGGYVVSNLEPGVYSVRAEAKGFKSVERRDILIEVATDVTVEIPLSPGDVKETIVVTSEVPLVNTTSSVLGARSAIKRSTIFRSTAGTTKIFSSCVQVSCAIRAADFRRPVPMACVPKTTPIS